MPDLLYRMHIPEFEWLNPKGFNKTYASNIYKYMHNGDQNIKAAVENI